MEIEVKNWDEEYKRIKCALSIDVADPLSEKRSSNSYYVQRDEVFSQVKQQEFTGATVSSALNGLLPLIREALVDTNLHFPTFKAIGNLFDKGMPIPSQAVISQVTNTVTEFKDDLLRFDPPELLNNWPLKSELDPKSYGPPESAITTVLVEREIKGVMMIDEALQQKKLFILDYHDLLLPYVNKVREIEGTTLYGLRTHCCMEPYIIASNRQLSAMELGSVMYDKFWQFDKQGLPADVISRGMAIEDPTAKHGLKLTVEDYPFTSDGLLLWTAIKQWVSDYVNHYYQDPNLIESDQEIQAWWTEVRVKGHEDKKDEPWWPVLKTQNDLIEILTTIIWVASAHHAAVKFGQFAYGGYFPNRPTIARTNMPTEDPTEQELQQFLAKPELALMHCYPSQIQAPLVMVVLAILSTHSSDEEYLGTQKELSWIEDPVVKKAYEQFNKNLKDAEGIIDARNKDINLKNRTGPGVVPYQLLKPFSKQGLTGMEIPNSISI